jgi:alcohol dehydrogenase class IV
MICGKLLAPVARANIKHLRSTGDPAGFLARYREVSRLVTNDPEASPEEAVAWLEDLCNTLEVPPLRDWGLKADEFPAVIDKALKASSMKGNPVKLTHDELGTILEESF